MKRLWLPWIIIKPTCEEGKKMKFEEIRKKINKIDRELLILLQERMGLALRSKKFNNSNILN